MCGNLTENIIKKNTASSMEVNNDKKHIKQTHKQAKGIKCNCTLHRTLFCLLRCSQQTLEGTDLMPVYFMFHVARCPLASLKFVVQNKNIQTKI